MTTTAMREAVIDLGAITANMRHLRGLIGTDHTMAVVKANAYGHGAAESARAALAGGADWLGVADIPEALALRDAGLTAPILAWLHPAGVDFDDAVRADIGLGLSSTLQLDAAVESAKRVGIPAHVQIKLETGLSRNGVHESDWADHFQAVASAQSAGWVIVDGIFSHLAQASDEEDARAAGRFTAGLELARSFGVDPELIHLASTAGALTLPDARFTMVRLGIGMYGLSPFDTQSSADLGLIPAMTLRTRVAGVRRATAGSGVSYGYDYRTPAATTLALIPLGYADGLPRAASDRAFVSVNGHRCPVRGRIAMDQIVVDAGDRPVTVGDEVIVFGDPTTGAPSADEWAVAASTINYEIVTRLGNRIIRRYVDAPPR